MGFSLGLRVLGDFGLLTSPGAHVEAMVVIQHGRDAIEAETVAVVLLLKIEGLPTALNPRP